VTRRTLTNRESRRTRAAPRLHLVRVLGYERPRCPGSRHDLDGVTEVTIGRGDRDHAVRGAATLELAIADPRMSASHARLVRDGAQWILEDRGSRNGSFVNGSPVQRGPVGDHDVIELGRTAFVVAALEHSGLDVDASALAAPIGDVLTFSPAFALELGNLAKVSLTTRSILIGGETGTGKEVLARAVHAASRRSGAFVAVNCGALSATLVESELFGYRKGAFSGATEDRTGLVRAADGGTLFLDEIGDLPLATQATLLRVLQEREVMPVGATRPIAIDLRVVAASHRDLEAEVIAGRFREDLYARLAGFVLELPALRERREDFGLLVAAVLTRAGADVTLAPEAGRALLAYGWPRNVRELDQALGAALALASDGVIELEHLPAAVRTAKADVSLESAPDDRNAVLRAALAKHGGNIAAVGRELGVARMQVHRWIARYGIDLDSYRRSRP
jgi:transcriptional regulator with PAS, ATPase and Fis domain